MRISDPQELLVKPAQSRISEYCTQLTGLTYPMLKRGVKFQDACRCLIRKGLRKYPSCAFGNDYALVEKQASALNQRSFLSECFFDMSSWLSFKHGVKEGWSLEKWMDYYGLKWEGERHRAGVDAYNLARLIQKSLILK